MQGSGLLQSQFPGVSIPNYFHSASNIHFLQIIFSFVQLSLSWFSKEFFLPGPSVYWPTLSSLVRVNFCIYCRRCNYFRDYCCPHSAGNIFTWNVIEFYQTTRLRIPEIVNLYDHWHGNLRSHSIKLFITVCRIAHMQYNAMSFYFQTGPGGEGGRGLARLTLTLL